MNIIEKLKVVLRPSTNQLAYHGMKEVEVHPSILKFNDGSIRVTIPDLKSEYEHHTCVVDSFIESMDDVMILAQIKEILGRFKVHNFYLNILSTPYTRYDRVMLDDQTDSFGAKVFSNIIKATGFDFINLFDCHSEVMLDLLSAGSIGQKALVIRTVGDLSDYNLIAPDKGAVKKNKQATIVFDKVRDVTNGQITGMQVSSCNIDDSKGKFLIVDDICEGGRTFLEVAKVFHREINHDVGLELYVTHGIFSNNAIEKLLQVFTKIHVYIMKKSVYDSLHDLDKSKLNIHTLVNI